MNEITSHSDICSTFALLMSAVIFVKGAETPIGGTLKLSGLVADG